VVLATAAIAATHAVVLILVALMSVSHNSPVSPLLIARRKPLFQVFPGASIDISSVGISTGSSKAGISKAGISNAGVQSRDRSGPDHFKPKQQQCGIVSGQTARLSTGKPLLAICLLPA
jgi:hypothetical protein